MTILVDVEEQRSPVPGHLLALGVDLEIVRLPVADYRVGARVAVERKTVADLHASLVSGRLWSQLFALRRVTTLAYLVVEGESLDRGRVTSRGVRGALLQIADTGTRVIRSTDAADTALWISLIGRRAQTDRQGVAMRSRGRRRMVVSPSGVLATVPGISPRLANGLLARFGSIAEIAAASESELQQVDGVGRARAAAVHRVLTKNTRTH